MPSLIENFRKSSTKEKNKFTFAIWGVIYIFVFSLALIFNFAAYLAMGVSIILAGIYSVISGYAFFDNTVLFGLFAKFHTKALGRLIGLLFVIFGFFVLSSGHDGFVDEAMKPFFVVYPALLFALAATFWVYAARSALKDENRKELNEEEIASLSDGLPQLMRIKRTAWWVLGGGIVLSIFSSAVYS